MSKVHLKVLGVDARHIGQSEFERNHQAACGYVRDNVTSDTNKVTCFYCKRSDAFSGRLGSNENKTT
ncbi:MAG: hypothetical protein CL840_15280 [Crocinitomicaceae bacterium]|nr:hypothetical protein [Crocinitomicaceae bacterium]